jgi:hypothetical protein
MSEQPNEKTPKMGTKQEGSSPGSAMATATRAPERLGGLPDGAEQVETPAGTLSEKEDLFTDDGKEGE